MRCRTVITRFDGDISKLSYLKDDVINAAYLVQPPADVAVARRRGGRDIFRTLFGASTSAELRSTPRSSKSSLTSSPISPAISIASPACRWSMPKLAATFNHSSDRYDLVQISLIDTWAATLPAVNHSRKTAYYTVEAWVMISTGR